MWERPCARWGGAGLGGIPLLPAGGSAGVAWVPSRLLQIVVGSGWQHRRPGDWQALSVQTCPLVFRAGSPSSVIQNVRFGPKTYGLDPTPSGVCV